MYIFSFVISLLLLGNNSYAAHIPTPTNNQSENYFLKLPDEVIDIIMIALIKNDGCEGLHALASVNKRLDQISKNNILAYLPYIDQSIEFEYYFTENPDGSYHEQNYYKFPLDIINTKKMLFIISNIKKLYTKDPSKIAKPIAQELKCFQYIVFHEEYCFRAMLPDTRCAWRDNYGNFISQTCQNYMGFFDQNYILEKNFFENFDTPEWQENKKAWTIEKIKNSDSKIAKLDLPKYTIRTNQQTWKDSVPIEINFPCSLFNLIVTIAYCNRMDPIKQDEPFETYLTNLFNDCNPKRILKEKRQQEQKKELTAKLKEAEQQLLEQKKDLEKLKEQKEQQEKNLAAKLKEKAKMNDQLEQMQEQKLSAEQEKLLKLKQEREQEKLLKQEQEQEQKLKAEQEKNQHSKKAQLKKFFSNNIVRCFLLIISLLFIKKIFSIFFNILHSFKGAQL